MEFDRNTVLLVLAVAAMAPLLADLLRRGALVVPVVVAEILLGIVIGPDVADVVEPDALLDALAAWGLAFLFFLAGMEIEPQRIRGRPLRQASIGWACSVVIAFAVVVPLYLSGFVLSELLVAAALTSTALGTLLPILGDAGVAQTRFGSYVLATGTVGEFGPIVLVAVLLTPGANPGVSVVLLCLFALVAGLVAAATRRVQPPRLVRVVRRTMHTSGQLPVRLAVLLLVALVFLASRFGLDVLLGAFSAGVIVTLVAGADVEVLRSKLDAIGFGFLIPIFFVTTGIEYDLDALVGSAGALLRVPLFLALFLVVRGLPALVLYARDVAPFERVPLALLSSTALPLVVAITTIGLEEGEMRPETAAALVGAGMLSVLIFPALAIALRARGAAAALTAGDPAPDAPVGSAPREEP